MVPPGKKVAIVGAGPVGALAALYFANADWDVEVYELRGDLRNSSNMASGTGKSINLALSERGINGLRNVGDGGKLLQQVLLDTIPMVGRMIHSGAVGKTGTAQGYDNVHGRFIRSADRAVLNMILLDELEEKENVELLFNHKLKKLNLDGDFGVLAEFERGDSKENKELVTVDADLIIGADGAHSTVRTLMQRYVKMYYEQTYIPTLWCEFTIPPTESGDFAISPSHLHIWPKQTYMFIAIPSTDKTFTCTLFMGEDMFDSITTPEALIAFFRENFADVLSYIGEGPLVKQYFGNQHLPLVSIRTGPYHYSDRAVIIGDAAHAMVPFYGQGMNAGFESARILFEKISAHPDDLGAALEAYTTERKSDAFAIVELAMQNYDEMRSGVTKPGYLVRKWVEEGLSKWLPSTGVQTLYSMVSFGNDRYSEVLVKHRRQNMIEERILTAMVIGVVGAVTWRTGVWRAVDVGVRAAVNAFFN
ncbi:hypothetical protein EDC01DRAFT_725601 [Geopyxis carbonaria]|nr:hypothetical protein EDC01DRAFT_725601 [Geopyxis carbonaria]